MARVDRERAGMGDRGRDAIRVWLEPVLSNACAHMANRMPIHGRKTRSKYIRACVVRCLAADGYPLGRVSEKFARHINGLERGVTACI